MERNIEGQGFFYCAEQAPICEFCKKELNKSAFYLCEICKIATCLNCRYLDINKDLINFKNNCDCAFKKPTGVKKQLCNFKYEKEA